MKRIISIILLMSSMILLLSSCSFLYEGLTMPNIKTEQTFENDKWLVIENRLINKIDGTVHYLKINDDATIPGVAYFYSDIENVYKYEFGESSLNQYTFLRVYPENSSSVLYYEYVITYGYDGKEIERTCIGEALTKAEMQREYYIKATDIEFFNFCVLWTGSGCIWDRSGLIQKADADLEGQAILEFCEEIYNDKSNGSYYTIEGIAKPMGNEIWFSTAGSNSRDFLRGNPLIRGISETKIFSYNLETKEFNTVFEYNKKGAQIIDFDENGAYILSFNGKLSYVEIETEKQTEIYKISSIDRIIITDKYVCVKYALDGYTYFVYEKGGSVIANDSPMT